MTSLFTLVPYYCIGTFQKNKLTGYSSLNTRNRLPPKLMEISSLVKKITSPEQFVTVLSSDSGRVFIDWDRFRCDYRSWKRIQRLRGKTSTSGSNRVAFQRQNQSSQGVFHSVKGGRSHHRGQMHNTQGTSTQETHPSTMKRFWFEWDNSGEMEEVKIFKEKH